MKLNTIHHGDALKLLDELDDNSVHALITDPPYSSGGAYRADRKISTGQKHFTSITSQSCDLQGDNMDAFAWLRWCHYWQSIAFDKMIDGGNIMQFTDWRQLPAAATAIQMSGFIFRGIFVWDKGGGAIHPNRKQFSTQCEFVVYGTKGASGFDHDRTSWAGCMSVPAMQSKIRSHPTQKPLSVLRHLVQAAPPGGLICDPFAGSGVTLKAAAMEGRQFVGFEISDKYYQSAKEMLEGEYGLFKDRSDYHELQTDSTTDTLLI